MLTTDEASHCNRLTLADKLNLAVTSSADTHTDDAQHAPLDIVG